METKDKIALVGVIVAIIALVPTFAEWLSPKPEGTVTLREKERVYIVQQPTSPPSSKSSQTSGYAETSSKSMENSASQNVVLSDATAILIISGSSTIDWTLSNQIKSILQGKGSKVSTPSLFTSSFVSKGQFEQIYQGNSAEAQRLRLSQHFKEGILGKKTVSFVENPDLENVITATVKLELHVISSASGTVQNSFSFAEKGPGFSRDDAEKNAIERILQRAESQL